MTDAMKCPSCGVQDWAVDCDITTRASVWVGTPNADELITGRAPAVRIDRCYREATALVVGSIQCNGCGWDSGGEIPAAYAELVEAVIKAAHATVQRNDDGVEWRVITDYRQY